MENDELMIRDALMQELQAHMFQYPKKLPSENELAAKYKVTRMTIRNVYTTLEKMGYIHSKQGIGHFPNEQRQTIEIVLKGDTSFSEKMLEQNIPYETRTVLCAPIEYDEAIFRILKADKSDTVYQVVRLRTVFHQPAAIHTSYVLERVFPDIGEKGMSVRSMFGYYRQKNHKHFSSKSSKLKVSFPAARERLLLKCGALVPLIVVETDCFDSDQDRILECTKVIYRSDLFEHKIR